MAQKYSIAADWDDVRTLDFSLMSTSFMGVGTALDNPARCVLFQNLTDVLLGFSINGVSDFAKLPSNSAFTWDVTANKASEAGQFFPEGSRVYVRYYAGGAPTSGEANVSIQFGEAE